MARFDPDRIAALAAGLLSPAEAEALEREIAEDPRAAAELAAQRLALAALAAAPTPMLSAVERTELRRKVADALNLGDLPSPQPAATRRRRPLWRPLAVAAAALALVAAIVPLAGLLSIGGEQEAANTTVAEMAAREEDGDTLATAGPLGGGNDTLGDYSTPDADEATQAILADPGALIRAADPDFDLCAADGRAALGTDEATGALLERDGNSLAAWFVLVDGVVDRLAIFDAADCRLLARAP